MTLTLKMTSKSKKESRKKNNKSKKKIKWKKQKIKKSNCKNSTLLMTLILDKSTNLLMLNNLFSIKILFIRIIIKKKIIYLKSPPKLLKKEK